MLVRLAVNRLARARLLENWRPFLDDPRSPSRREVMRHLGRWGLSAGLAILLPSVRAILAPTAAQTATCVTPTDCSRRPRPQCERVPLIEILARAGVRPTARRVTLTRWQDGRPTTVVVDLTTPEKYTTLVAPGDILEVQSPREYVFITGEVRTPQAIEYVPGLTLSQAIIHAGGPSEFAKRSRVQIKRRRADGRVEVFQANLDKIIRGQAPDVELHPNDTVYVPRRFW